MVELPPNVAEFNVLAGLILAKLYRSFPVLLQLEPEEFATEMGISASEMSSRKLASGVTFIVLWTHTLDWLFCEGFVHRPNAPLPALLTLTMQGLRALNAVPSGLQQTLGTAIAERGASGNLSGIGDFIGSAIGGFTKSIAGG
jgi:hypothetical protein